MKTSHGALLQELACLFTPLLEVTTTETALFGNGSKYKESLHLYAELIKTPGGFRIIVWTFVLGVLAAPI
jgi:hypothetical protein